MTDEPPAAGFGTRIAEHRTGLLAMPERPGDAPAAPTSHRSP